MYFKALKFWAKYLATQRVYGLNVWKLVVSYPVYALYYLESVAIETDGVNKKKIHKNDEDGIRTHACRAQWLAVHRLNHSATTSHLYS